MKAFLTNSATLKNFAYSLLLALALCACEKPVPLPEVANSVELTQPVENANASVEQAFSEKQSDVQVRGKGVVVKLLADDKNGSQHQKFLVKINARQTLLFAHNIDLAARVPLQVGDEVTFSGEYVYNPKGGVVHWTHRDPRGHHVAGWLAVHGNKYQ
ncbi:hypothetical protein GALL_154490 [mine drainage metagenome]|uniref:DUF3465 domain-containing protein n=1 Tax=mine drainage metagenome TaxID=410659 RepID=A0A1J5S343_9ZZZZ